MQSFDMSEMDQNSARGNFGGYGGLLVAEHYRKCQELQREAHFRRQIKTIAPRVGSEEYFEWLKRQGVNMNFSLF